MRVSELIELGEKVLTMFDDFAAGRETPRPRVEVRHFCTELEVSENGSRCQSSSEIVEKPDRVRLVFDFMQEIVRPLPEFTELGRSLAKRYKENVRKMTSETGNVEAQCAFWLETFLQLLIYEKLDGTLTKHSVIDYASLLKSELELVPYDYSYVLQLGGVFVESDTVRINDNVLIRKTRKSDLEYTRDLFMDLPTRAMSHMAIPSSVLEVVLTARDEALSRKYVDRILDSLRLYKVGSVHATHSNVSKRTVIWPTGTHTQFGHPNYSTFTRYTVKQADEPAFVEFVSGMEQYLNFDKDEKRYRGLAVSEDRYKLALLEAPDIETRIMAPVMGLESLFMLEKDRGENAFKLGIRVAKLLGHIGFDPVRVRECMEQAYNFRNKIAHGSYVSQTDKGKMNQIVTQALDYLRVSLVVFLGTEKTGKEKMVDMIDRSTISDTENERLRKLLNETKRQFPSVLLWGA